MPQIAKTLLKQVSPILGTLVVLELLKALLGREVALWIAGGVLIAIVARLIAIGCRERP